MAERSLLSALVHGKCPRCRQGDIFTYRISKISRFNVMNSTCPHCGVMLQPEPGFYQGAMYVSYAFGLGAIIVSSLLLYLAGNRSEWVYIGVVVALILFLAPVNYGE